MKGRGFCLEECNEMVGILDFPELETDVLMWIETGAKVPSVDVHEVRDDVQRPCTTNQEPSVANDLAGCFVVHGPTRVDGWPMLGLPNLG